MPTPIGRTKATALRRQLAPQDKMKTYLTALAFVFALAIGVSMMTLTGQVDRAQTDRGGSHRAAPQKIALLY
jgi:hypothetical protein